MKKIVVLLLISFCAVEGYAQRFGERSIIRSGNRNFERGNYVEAEVDYAKANSKSPIFEGLFNHADALYKQGRYEEAMAGYQSLVEAPLNQNTPSVFYNTGNSLYNLNKLKEAEEAYKMALRLNPKDQDAKFNLAYVQKKLEQNDNQDQNKDQNKDNKDQDQNKDQNKDQDKNKDNQDQNKDKQNPENNQDKQDQKDQQGGMNKQEAEQMLKAMEANEANTRDKVDEDKKKKGVVVRSGRNW